MADLKRPAQNGAGSEIVKKQRTDDGAVVVGTVTKEARFPLSVLSNLYIAGQATAVAFGDTDIAISKYSCFYKAVSSKTGRSANVQPAGANHAAIRPWWRGFQRQVQS